MSEALNTHSYDSKWHENLALTNEKYKEFLSSKKTGENHNIIALSTLDDVAKNQAIHWRNIMVSSKEFDAVNNVSPLELLEKIEYVLSIRFSEDKQHDVSLIDLYVEQLADISNGSCIQGQTTRLFQIYVCLMT